MDPATTNTTTLHTAHAAGVAVELAVRGIVPFAGMVPLRTRS